MQTKTNIVYIHTDSSVEQRWFIASLIKTYYSMYVESGDVKFIVKALRLDETFFKCYIKEKDMRLYWKLVTNSLEGIRL